MHPFLIFLLGLLAGTYFAPHIHGVLSGVTHKAKAVAA